MYFAIYKNNRLNQPYWWVIKSAGNHKTLAHSETYTRKSDCYDAIQLVARGAAGSMVYDQTGE